MWGVACSPLIEENLVIVQPGGTKGSVAAFDRRDGKLVWNALEEPSGYSSPVAVTCAGVRQVICFTADGLVGLRPTDGGVLWEYPWKTQYSANIATPIVAGDYVFLSSGYNTGCALLQLSPEGEGVRCDAVWIKRNKLMRNHQSTCVLRDGFLYGFDSRGAERVDLRCVDLRTGDERWVTRDVGKGVPLLADGHLVLLYEDGTLRLAEATPEAYRERGSFAALSGREVWALPALARGRLYVRSHKEVVCLDVGQ
jgi:outer membrane protein assembly factor BamB